MKLMIIQNFMPVGVNHIKKKRCDLISLLLSHAIHKSLVKTVLMLVRTKVLLINQNLSSSFLLGLKYLRLDWI